MRVALILGMSISSLIMRKVARDQGPPLLPLSPNPGEGQAAISDAISIVVSYIPTEVVTLYVVVLGILTESNKTAGMPVLIAFLAATPLMVWLVYAVRERESGRPIPWKPSEWPLWEMGAALVSFTVWSAALPRGALESCSWYEPDLAAVSLLVVSLLLPLIGRLAKK